MSETKMPTVREITDRWRWDDVGATRRKIQLAVKVTKNVFGITCGGVPYVRPKAGDRVRTSAGATGTIVSVKLSVRDRDPEAVIDTDDGRRVYLFQTAICGYSVVHSLPVVV